MSFFKSLLGIGAKKPVSGKAPSSQAQIEYEGFVVLAEPYQDGGQYQLAGRIEKEVAGELKSYRFVRADRFSSLDDAVNFSLSKGRQIVDLEGERLFR